MKKNLFQDPYEHISASETSDKTVRPVATSRQELWTDRRTGAQYTVQSSSANPADADFSDASKLAESRYLSVMGLPEKSFHQRPTDDPFAEDRLKPEKMPLRHEIEDHVRERARFDVQRSEAFRATNEPVESDIVDHGEYTTNSKGEIRDKPMNTIGPFGTELMRSESKSTKDDTEQFNRRQRNDNALLPTAPQRPDLVETKVGEHRGLQKVLSSAYRSLFGNQFADHIVHRSENTSSGRSETSTAAHSVMEAGFMKPWVPSEHGRDRNQKPDGIVQAVGTRAIATLMKGPLKSEIPDLPKAEREALTTALGRTILHALTKSPESGVTRSTMDLKTKHELKKSMMNALSPEILRGIIPTEMLDRDAKKEVSNGRTGAPVQKAIQIPSRRLEQEGHNSRFEDKSETVESRPNSEFGLFRKSKKTLFDFA